MNVQKHLKSQQLGKDLWTEFLRVETSPTSAEHLTDVVNAWL